ncbi:lysine-specific demethylase 4A isoform X2 [Conger conger]|uniref:lysine-specific demethylase 4A isoform X2 n=1 Tax=Conger conger TaxID=82655 RepID=UPI002A59B9FB|nr:lysine-specific demethylase 4A isoform X2 [Conger conger]
MALDSGSQNPGSRSIMTFYPTKEEFGNFNRYMAYIESQGAHRAGLAKIVPPKEWKPRRSYDDIDELVIPAPIQQVVTGQSGLFTQYNIQKKPMTVREFRKTANSDKFCSPRYVDFEELERKYWKNLTFNPPIYGADVNGTLYDPDVTEWNIGRLNTILDTVECDSGIVIEGVNTPYLYFGMWKTTFAWHTEDMDLYSINYLHFGEPKSWYCVPPEHGKRLERLAKGFFSGSSQNCEAFLRHKMTLISPSILRKYGIPFEKITQEAGEFMVTFPYGYHAGFNHGFNCAESTNFATQRWIEYGKQATLCSCRKDMVKISMDVFVRKYQPDRYKLWKAGKDNAPIDHSKPTPEAAEFLGGEAAVQSREEHCEDPRSDGEKRSLSKQRIGTKRHRVCLELPEEVLSKEEDSEQEEECEEVGAGKKARLSIPPERKLEDAVKGLSTMDIHPKHGALLGAKHIISLTLRQGPSASPLQHGGPNALPPPKPGVASLLFHRTLSPTEALHVHSYAKERYAAPLPTVEERRPQPPPAAPANWRSEAVPACRLKVVHQGAVVEPVCKTMKSKRLPLSKLPRLHPLIQDCLSDEEPPELAPEEEEDEEEEEEEEVQEEEEEEEEEEVQEEKEEEVQEEEEEEEEVLVQEREAWAKPLAQLWQNRPHNLKAEKEYNYRMGLLPPYCAVCLLFQTYQQSQYCSSSHRPAGALGEGMRTAPLIPEMCFTTTNNSEVHFSSPYLEEDGTSQLLSCSQCSVRVHTSCYGVPPESVSSRWKCARCQANAVTEDCCLCSLRGGALHRANNDKWVHVLCAVAVLEARFVNLADRSPVDLSGIPLQRFKLKCFYCKKRMRKGSGCCVQCSHGRCPTSFHATCAQAAGVLMQPDDWPFVVYMTCWRHKGPVNTAVDLLRMGAD